MADADARGAKDCVEGFDPREKKPLEKVLAPARLQELKKEQKQLEVKVKKELENEQKKMMDLQNKLNDCNKEYADKKRELDEVRAVQHEKLTPSQQLQITRLASRTADSFLQRRPHREVGDDEKTVDVDVHYLPSMEAGQGLRIGGEGAGSRDAKFPVKLSENVKTLAKRAATYWGLDADKVFFLDRDGRIVFEDMSLREIILPPVHRAAPSDAGGDSGALAVENGGAGGDSRRGSAVVTFAPTGDTALEQYDPAAGHWTVKGRNYNLTLVRAVVPGEVPATAQNKPKGEAWQDFTFDQKKLVQDLKDTLAKYGDPEFEDSKIEMEDIPSLYDLIETGKKKKAQKRADTACRLVEFLIFLVAYCSFHYLLLPSYNWSVSMRLVARGIEQSFTEFNIGERLGLGIRSYKDIASERQFQAWVEGPLQRSVSASGLESRNLFVLSLVGVRFSPTPHEVEPPRRWCPAVPASVAPSSATDVGLNASGANASNATNDTNATNETANGTVAEPAPSPAAVVPNDCSPVSLQSCLNTRVVDVFTLALQDGDLVPPCKPIFARNMFLLWWDSMAGEEVFTYIRGEVSSYYGGQQSVIDRQNASTYLGSVSSMALGPGDVATPARMFLLFIYTPSLNGVFVYKLLIENTLSGGLLTKQSLNVINLSTSHEATFTISSICIVLAFVCFLSELRRIMGCPKRCTFEQRRDHCSCWTFIFLLVPLAMLVGFAIFSARFVHASENVLEMDPATNSLSQASIESLYEVTNLDYYNRLINLAVLVLLNALLFRYLLMYFPQLSFLTAMVSKLVKPLWYTFLFLAAAFLVFATFLYVMYSAQNSDFRNFVVAVAQSVKFAQGGSSNWYELYTEYATLYTIVNLIGFIVIQLMLSNVPLAVMLSHKKEKDLRQNYSYHRFWAGEISRMGKGRGEFNPALINEKEKDGKDQGR